MNKVVEERKFVQGLGSEYFMGFCPKAWGSYMGCEGCQACQECMHHD